MTGGRTYITRPVPICRESGAVAQHKQGVTTTQSATTSLSVRRPTPPSSGSHPGPSVGFGGCATVRFPNPYSAGGTNNARRWACSSSTRRRATTCAVYRTSRSVAVDGQPRPGTQTSALPTVAPTDQERRDHRPDAYRGPPPSSRCRPSWLVRRASSKPHDTRCDYRSGPWRATNPCGGPL